MLVSYAMCWFAFYNLNSWCLMSLCLPVAAMDDSSEFRQSTFVDSFPMVKME